MAKEQLLRRRQPAVREVEAVVGPVGAQPREQASDVLRCSPVYDVEILGEDGRSQHDGRHASDHDELDSGLVETPEHRVGPLVNRHA
jgi:hypothetical protein